MALNGVIYYPEKHYLGLENRRLLKRRDALSGRTVLGGGGGTQRVVDFDVIKTFWMLLLPVQSVIVKTSLI